MMDGDYEIEWHNPAMLRRYPYNARTHSEEQVDQIIAAINEFGFTNPILIDDDDGIIAGHGRQEAAIKMGRSRVPCLRLSGMSDEQKRAYVLADNKLALNAGWDTALLRLELQELQAAGFDIDVIGFDDSELNEILKGLEEGGGEGGEPDEFTLVVTSSDEAEIIALRKIFHLRKNGAKLQARDLLAMLPV